MKVALDAFQGELGPLVDQSWERTSIKELGFRRVSACLAGAGAVSGRM
jgi:hypothetical protein